MSDCDKGTGNCPPQYKNIQSESFGDMKRVTSDLLFQYCKNDAYLYNEILKLWDKTDPEHRKRFYPPYYMDVAKSYGIEELNINRVKDENDKNKIRPLDCAYHLSNTLHERYEVDFDYTNDYTEWEQNGNGTYDTLVINNDSIIEDSSTLHIVTKDIGVTESPRIVHSVLPVPVSKTISNDIPFKTTSTKKITTKTTVPVKKKVVTKEDVYGKLKLDAHCSGPYKDWKANSVWYIGFNRHKNYNIKNTWRKNPDLTSIPSVCRAQTFKAEQTGELRKVTFQMRGSNKSVSPCIVEIRTVAKNGKPTQKVLARTEQKFNHNSKTMVNFTFKKPCIVKKGTIYAIVLRSPLSNFNHCYWISGWASTCFSNSRKRAYYDGETFLSEDNGKTWIVHGSKEKCYGSHYYDWGFAEAPVNFGFEVYIAPKTGTKNKTKYVSYKKTTTSTSNQTTTVTDNYTATVSMNYYEKGDYYLEFKPFTGNFYTSITCIYNIDNRINNLNHGTYDWEIFNNEIDDATDEVIGWQSFEDYNNRLSISNTVIEGKNNYTINFIKALTYVKVRLKLTLDGNIIAYEDDDDGIDVNTELQNNLSYIASKNNVEWDNNKINEWVDKVYDEFLWVDNDHNPLSIRQLRSVEFLLDKKPSFKGYLRTLEYHPAQEGMLPACIWSEVNAEGIAKNNGNCKVDIVYERNSIDRILLYKADNMDLRPYIIDYEETVLGNLDTETSYMTKDEIRDYIINTQDYSVKDDGFISYLKEQNPKVYLLPYKYTNTETNETCRLYFFGDNTYAPLELSNYPAYPINSCSVGTENITLNLNETEWTLYEDTDFITYTCPDTVQEKVNNISVIYRQITDETNDETDDLEVERVVLSENNDYVIEDNTIIFNVNKPYSETDLTDLPILNGFFTISNNTVTVKESDAIDMGSAELVVEMNSYDYNEFQHYLADYENKTLNFYSPNGLPEGELKINYNPLWVRNLSIEDFPLKMDLWTEYYRAVDVDGVLHFSKCKLNKCGKVVIGDEDNVGSEKIVTSVPALDNIRKLEVQDWQGNAKTGSEMIEDIDYVVDYLTNEITFKGVDEGKQNKITEDDIIMIKYTPNLTDTGLSLGYRVSRPLYDSNDNSISETLFLDRSSYVNNMENGGDDFYILSNYFTTRT